MGKLIVLEGLDGSGKTTQTPILAEYIQSLGFNVKTVSFPDYENNSSMLVRMYLGGEFGTNPLDVNAYAASSFYACDRFASFKKCWKKDYEDVNTVIVATRYTTSNAYHQLSKLEQSEWDYFLNWLEDYEYNKLGIPRPDRVLFLDMDPSVSTSRAIARSGEKADIHEKDLGYLNRCRIAANYAANKLGWLTIKCFKDNKALSIDNVSQIIKEDIKNYLIK